MRRPGRVVSTVAGYTIRQVEYLRLLADLEEEGTKATVRVIAERAGVANRSVYHELGWLREQGLATWNNQPGEGALLTAAGQAAMKAIEAAEINQAAQVILGAAECRVRASWHVWQDAGEEQIGEAREAVHDALTTLAIAQDVIRDLGGLVTIANDVAVIETLWIMLPPGDELNA